MGRDGGTFKTLKFSLQLLAQLHLLQEQLLQFVCERGESGRYRRGVCRNLTAQSHPGSAPANHPEIRIGASGVGR